MSEGSPNSTSSASGHPPLDQTLASDPLTHPEPALVPAPTDPLSGPPSNPPSSTQAALAGLPTVNGYEVLAELGRGGMGVVYKAKQLSLNRPVALKMIRDSILASPEQMARLRAEAEAAGKLQHPNIVQIYDYAQHQGIPSYAMEFVPGGSLAQKWQGKPQPAIEVAELLEELARAVHYAHQQGIIHRDLKPANVLLAPDGTPKISDFGLAKQLDAVGTGSNSAVLGTPSYMAPEQAIGRSKEIGPTTDVYALGALLYEALTGHPPFQGETLLQTLDQVRFQEPIVPTQVRPDLPLDLETICLRCLQKEGNRRYPTAAALAEDLQNFLSGRPITELRTPNDQAHLPSVSGFEIWGELARGGVWVVYKARDVRGKRLVALKQIRSGSPLTTPQLLRLRATAELAQRLNHPHIASLYEFGGALAHLYLATELVEGGSLQQKLAGLPLHAHDERRLPADAAALLEMLARAAHHAHEHGLIHCHLRLNNVLLTPASNRPEASGLEQRLGCPKIIGYEMAQRREDLHGSDDLQAIRPITYSMAPEQLFNRRAGIGPATDVYGLGVILYECLTGQPLHRATTTSDLLLKASFDLVQPPHRLNRSVPSVLGRICLKCLEKDPRERYPTALMLAEDLLAFQQRRATSVGHPKSLVERGFDWLRAQWKGT